MLISLIVALILVLVILVLVILVLGLIFKNRKLLQFLQIK